MNNENPSKIKRFFKTDFSSMLKNLFFLFIIIQMAPSIFSTIGKALESVMHPKSYVGYLSIEGPINDSVYYTKRIEEFAKNKTIEALFIKIDSPGGYPGSSEAIYRELKKFKAKKPVIVLVENMCASGAYYVAAAAHKIIVPSTSIVGSIGNFARFPNVTGLLDQYKVKVNYVQSGQFKTAGAPFKESSAEEVSMMQELSDSIYEQFVNDVAVGRGLDSAQVKTWADGRVFSGAQGLALKLVDRIGSYQDAIEELKEIAHITREISFVSLKKRPSGIMRMLMGDEEYNEQALSVSGLVSSCMKTIVENVITYQQAIQVVV